MSDDIIDIPRGQMVALPAGYKVAPAIHALLPHKAGLCLEHNEHRTCHQSVADYLGLGGEHFEFRDAESRKRCIDADDIWTLQWYPETPVGFLAVAAPTLDELIVFANEIASRDA